MATKCEKGLELKDVITLLIKHFDIHEGMYDLGLEFQIGVGNFGPNKEKAYPGAAIGLAGIKLVESAAMGPHTVDAAKCNPAATASEKKAPRKTSTK